MKKPYTLPQIIERLSLSMERHETRVIERSAFAALSAAQIHYLDVIHHSGNPTLSELAGKLGITKPSVTAIVGKLHKLGYVRKVLSDSDRRCSHVHLTAKGKKIARLHDDIHEGYAENFRKALSEKELDVLISLLGKVIASMGI